MSFEKRKVVMLPTNEKAIRVGDITLPIIANRVNEGHLGLAVRSFKVNDAYRTQHLYILSDEEIKEGDWFMCFNKVLKCQEVDKYGHTKANGKWQTKDDCKKIIASTDTSLRIPRKDSHPNSVWKTDGALLPQPSQSFIEKYITEYNKGNIITNVMVEYERMYLRGGKNKHLDKFEPKISKGNTITIRKIKDSWTREDIIHAFTSGHNKAKMGITHSDALLQYKEEQNL